MFPFDGNLPLPPFSIWGSGRHVSLPQLYPRADTCLSNQQIPTSMRSKLEQRDPMSRQLLEPLEKTSPFSLGLLNREVVNSAAILSPGDYRLDVEAKERGKKPTDKKKQISRNLLRHSIPLSLGKDLLHLCELIFFSLAPI